MIFPSSKEAAIRGAAERYNSRSLEMQNPKTLLLRDIGDDSIFLTLESALPLSSLGRALRTFSVILVKEMQDADSAVYRKKRAAFEQIERIAFEAGLLEERA